MKVEHVEIGKLKYPDYNPRKWTEKAKRELKDSLREFDFVQPIIVNKAKGRENIIIGGSFKVAMAKEMGRKTVPVYFVTIADIDKERELNLRLNKNQGEWDFNLLADFDEVLLQQVGFDSQELDKVFAKKDAEDDFDVDAKVKEIGNKPKTKLGDIYILGEHRLLCGDTTSEEAMSKLMNKEKARIVFTSPPYWLGFEYEKENAIKEILEHIAKAAKNMVAHTKSKIIINTGNIAAITKAEKLTGKKQVALLIDWWRDELNRQGFLLRHIRIWAKSGQMKPSSRNDSVDMHWEYIGTFTEEEGNAGFIANFYNEHAAFEGQYKMGPEGQGWATNGIWVDIKGNARSNNHVAAFPVELVVRHLKMYTERKDLILEPYCGSGTTLIACETMGRRCFGMELDPVYCDVIVDRWEQLTGQKAVKQSELSKQSKKAKNKPKTKGK